MVGSGQAVRRLTLDQEIEGSNPSSPAKSLSMALVVLIGLLIVMVGMRTVARRAGSI
jgi:hypothetical protein